MDENSENLVFKKIKQLVRSDPFIPFALRSGSKDIEITHPNAIAFHPEVPFLTIYDKSEIYDVLISAIAFVQREHAH